MPPLKAKIISRKNLTHDVIEVELEYPTEFNFVAGQFITLKIEDGGGPCFRAYSIASAPNNPPSKNFKLCVKVVSNGRGSNWLNSTSLGTETLAMGPNGKFNFKTPANCKSLFIGTGTGVAPLISMIQDELKKGNKSAIELLFGVRHEEDIFYHDLLEELTQKHSNFSYKITLSKPISAPNYTLIGRVTDHLKNTETDKNNTVVYICGLKEMIESVNEILKSKGLSDENIHFEKYD